MNEYTIEVAEKDAAYARATLGHSNRGVFDDFDAAVDYANALRKYGFEVRVMARHITEWWDTGA